MSWPECSQSWGWVHAVRAEGGVHARVQSELRVERSAHTHIHTRAHTHTRTHAVDFLNKRAPSSCQCTLRVHSAS